MTHPVGDFAVDPLLAPIGMIGLECSLHNLPCGLPQPSGDVEPFDFGLLPHDVGHLIVDDFKLRPCGGHAVTSVSPHCVKSMFSTQSELFLSDHVRDGLIHLIELEFGLLAFARPPVDLILNRRPRDCCSGVLQIENDLEDGHLFPDEQPKLVDRIGRLFDALDRSKLPNDLQRGLQQSRHDSVREVATPCHESDPAGPIESGDKLASIANLCDAVPQGAANVGVGTRTQDLRIKSPLLYQLSYAHK